MIKDIHAALAKIQPGEIVEIIHKNIKGKLK
jgi:TusA-related sulfurtransferase